jgi:hypothetical protein
VAVVVVDPGVDESGVAIPGSAEAPCDVSVDPHESGTEVALEAMRQRVPGGVPGMFAGPLSTVCPVGSVWPVEAGGVVGVTGPGELDWSLDVAVPDALASPAAFALPDLLFALSDPLQWTGAAPVSS